MADAQITAQNRKLGLSGSMSKERHEQIFGKKDKGVEPKRERLYFFTMPDGKGKMMSAQEAFKYDDKIVKDRLNQIRENTSNKIMKKDGFAPGWQENIQEYCGGRKEYDAKLKEKGLVEIGNDYIPQESGDGIHPCANKEFVEAAAGMGIEMSDTLESSITSGKFFEE